MSCSLTGGNSAIPESIKNDLTPSTPAVNNSSKSSILCGTTPPQKPQSTQSLSLTAANFSSKAVLVIVTGIQFNGISTKVVIPPAAAAWVAVLKPSHSVRPGSLICTCESTKPGINILLPRSSIKQAVSKASNSTS